MSTILSFTEWNIMNEHIHLKESINQKVSAILGVDNTKIIHEQFKLGETSVIIKSNMHEISAAIKGEYQTLIITKDKDIVSCFKYNGYNFNYISIKNGEVIQNKTIPKTKILGMLDGDTYLVDNSEVIDKIRLRKSQKRTDSEEPIDVGLAKYKKIISSKNEKAIKLGKLLNADSSIRIFKGYLQIHDKNGTDIFRNIINTSNPQLFKVFTSLGISVTKAQFSNYSPISLYIKYDIDKSKNIPDAFTYNKYGQFVFDMSKIVKTDTIPFNSNYTISDSSIDKGSTKLSYNDLEKRGIDVDTITVPSEIEFDAGYQSDASKRVTVKLNINWNTKTAYYTVDY